MKQSFLFFIFLLTNVGYGFCQKEVSDPGQDVLYRSEKMFGGGVHRIGFHMGYRTRKGKSVMKKSMYSFELLNMRHPKEVKFARNGVAEDKTYRYGKLNSMIVFRSGIFWQKTLAAKESLRNIEIKCNYHVGPSIAFLKPVYLIVDNGSDRIIERYDPDEHNPGNIYGRATYNNGLLETKVMPGLYTQLGLNFDFSSYYDRVMAIEVGLTADMYLKKIPLMAIEENQSFILSYYISFYMGKKFHN